MTCQALQKRAKVRFQGRLRLTEIPVRLITQWQVPLFSSVNCPLLQLGTPNSGPESMLYTPYVPAIFVRAQTKAVTIKQGCQGSESWESKQYFIEGVLHPCPLIFEMDIDADMQTIYAL